MRLLLAASGGGHLRQLLDLEPLWTGHDCLWVTEDTALGRSLARDRHVVFVPHVALGQAKLGRAGAMVAGAVRSVPLSWTAVRRFRPDAVITTGAGSVAPAVLAARIVGARLALVDSFARFDGPSAFAKLVGPFAHRRIAQSPGSAMRWTGAELFDPFRVLDTPPPPKDELAFVTVGATLPFPRLIAATERAMADGLMPARVVAQIGSGAGPRNADVVETLPFDELNRILERAELVVCHGGTGSIITALQHGCRVVVMPRLHALGEHYDDHQLQIATALASRGLVSVAGAGEDLAPALAEARARPPRRATLDPAALIESLDGWLARLE